MGIRGNQIRSGLDIDGNGQLETASADRITERNQGYIFENGNWYLQTESRVFAEHGSATATPVDTHLVRLTGPGEDNFVAGTVTTDIHGNKTIKSEYIDRSLKTKKQIVDYPDSEIHGETVTVKTKYNANDRVEWIEDAAGFRTSFSYDPASGELTDIDYSDTTPDIVFTYDRLGRQVSITDALGVRTFEYNANLQQSSATITGLYDEVIRRQYEDTEMIGRSSGFDLGTTYGISYDYDPTGRLNAVSWETDTNSGHTSYAYLLGSDFIERIESADLTTTRRYETHRNLQTRVSHDFGAQRISQYDYMYDELGRRTSLITSGIAFDQKTTPPPEPETQIYQSNELNQYTKISYGSDQQAAMSFSYDDDGNLTRISGSAIISNLEYDAENRLVKVEKSTSEIQLQRVEFVYDYMGRRVKRSVSTSQDGNWQLDKETLFVYDGWNLIKEIARVPGQAEKAKYYVCGLDLSQSLQRAGGVGGLLAVVDDGKTYHYLYDGNGNVGQVVDSADGSVVAHYEYFPFGELRHSYGDYKDENAFRFSTKYFDAETDLYYYGFRFYSPELGRWINRDPPGERGGFNLYLFSQNNPSNKYDILGLLVRCSP